MPGSKKEMKLKEQKLEAEIALKESQGELHRLKTQIAAGERMKGGYKFVVSIKIYGCILKYGNAYAIMPLG